GCSATGINSTWV
ncbi:hypothetical protein VCHC78A1_01309B, partial [Vibrio cholerae HC-78A1]